MNARSSGKGFDLMMWSLGALTLAACATTQTYSSRVVLPVTSQDLKTGAPLVAHDTHGRPVYSLGYSETVPESRTGSMTGRSVEVVTVSKVALPQAVHFAESSSALSNEHQRTLRLLADELKQGSGKLLVAGYTDPKGSSEANYKLGLKRAHSVKNFLVKHGVSASRIEVKSLGKTSEPERKVVVSFLPSGKGE